LLFNLLWRVSFSIFLFLVLSKLNRNLHNLKIKPSSTSFGEMDVRTALKQNPISMPLLRRIAE